MYFKIKCTFCISEVMEFLLWASHTRLCLPQNSLAVVSGSISVMFFSTVYMVPTPNLQKPVSSRLAALGTYFQELTLSEESMQVIYILINSFHRVPRVCNKKVPQCKVDIWYILWIAWFSFHVALKQKPFKVSRSNLNIIPFILKINFYTSKLTATAQSHFFNVPMFTYWPWA